MHRVAIPETRGLTLQASCRLRMRVSKRAIHSDSCGRNASSQFVHEKSLPASARGWQYYAILTQCESNGQGFYPLLANHKIEGFNRSFGDRADPEIFLCVRSRTASQPCVCERRPWAELHTSFSLPPYIISRMYICYHRGARFVYARTHRSEERLEPIPTTQGATFDPERDPRDIDRSNSHG